MNRGSPVLPARARVAAFAADQDTARQAVRAGRCKPLAEILAAVQARYPGRVLDVELDRNRSGRNIYEVKLLSVGGERQEIHIDAMTGEEVAPDAPLRLLPAAQLLRQALAHSRGAALTSTCAAIQSATSTKSASWTKTGAVTTSLLMHKTAKPSPNLTTCPPE